MPVGLPYQLKDYLELVDWTGRQIREDKRGRIEDDEPPILSRLGIKPAHWLYLTQHYESSFKSLVVARASCERRANRWVGRKVIAYR